MAALSTKVERLGLSGGDRGPLRTLQKQETQAPLEMEKGQVAGTEESVLGHSAIEGHTGIARTVNTDLRDH